MPVGAGGGVSAFSPYLPNPFKQPIQPRVEYDPVRGWIETSADTSGQPVSRVTQPIPTQPPPGDPSWNLSPAEQQARNQELANAQRTAAQAQEARDRIQVQAQGLGVPSTPAPMAIPPPPSLGGLQSAAGLAGGQPTVLGSGVSAAGADAAYARARDKIGEQARASLNALRDAAAETGAFVTGGENPALRAAEASIINRSQGALGDVVRQQAIDQAALAAERENMALAAQYAEQAATRGANIDLQRTAYEAQLAANRQQAQQQADQQARYMDNVLSALAGVARLY